VTVSIGVAFVGCAHPHLPPRCELLAAEKDVRLVGCYDPDPVLAAKAHARTGLPIFDSVDQLLDQPDVRLAMVEGWHRDNPGLVLAAWHGSQ
jgi:predicted dehydrogenase